MNTATVNLREVIPFGIYKYSSIHKRMNTFHLPIEFEVTHCEKNPQIVGKTFDVVDLSSSEITINQSKTHKYQFDDLHFYTNKIEGNLMFDKKIINLESLVKELNYKEATAEFSKLPFTILKDGKYLANYFPDSLIGFFKQSEENFFMLEQCIINYKTHDRFQFPQRADERAKLESYIKETYPGLYNSLDKLFLEPTPAPFDICMNKPKSTTQRPT